MKNQLQILGIILPAPVSWGSRRSRQEGRALLLRAVGGHLGPGAGGPCRPVTGLCPGRVVVTLNPQLGAQWEVTPEKGEELELSAENLCELREPEPSPFSSKRTMYKSCFFPGYTRRKR